MTLIGLVVFIIILGLLFWLVGMLPIPEPFHRIVYVLLVIIAILWLLSAFGLLGTGHNIRLS